MSDESTTIPKPTLGRVGSFMALLDNEDQRTAVPATDGIDEHTAGSSSDLLQQVADIVAADAIVRSTNCVTNGLDVSRAREALFQFHLALGEPTKWVTLPGEAVVNQVPRTAIKRKGRPGCDEFCSRCSKTLRQHFKLSDEAACEREEVCKVEGVLGDGIYLKFK
jgi:hypothetical protein